MKITNLGSLRAAFTLVLAFSVLSACGGGGGDTGASPATTTTMINATENGHTDNVTLTLAGDRFNVGDDGAGGDYRGLLRFPLATVPAGATVVGAFLNISFLSKNGTPAGTGVNNLGKMQFMRIDGTGALHESDYGLMALAHDAANDLAVDLPNLRPRIGLLQPVLSALATGDAFLKLRLQYQTADNGNGVADNMEFAAIAHATELEAVLEIITVP